MEKSLAVKVVCITFFLITFLLAFRTLFVLSHTLTPDFGVYYQAAKNIVASQSVYVGKNSFTLFAYPLVSGLFFIPFSALPYMLAQTLFLLCSFTALIGISILVPKIVQGKFSFLGSALVFSFSYMSFPTKFTLGMGQINLIAYFFLLMSLFFYLSRSDLDKSVKVRPLLLALFFAIACILKPILGFTLLFFICQRQWKVIAYIVLLFCLFFSFSVAIDHHALLDYFYYFHHVVPEITKSVGREIYYNQGWMGFVFREITHTTLRLWFGYAGIAGLVGLLFISLHRQKNHLYQISLLLSALPLVDSMSWQHHFVFLILPFFYAAFTFTKARSWVRMAFLCLAYILVSTNIAQPQLIHFPWTFLLSNTFYGGMLLFILLLFYPSTSKKSIRLS